TVGNVAHDSVGGHDGTLSPTGAAFVPGGVSGNALSLSRSSNGFVNMGNILDLSDGDFSIAAWVKMTAGDTTDRTKVLSKHVSGYANGYLLSVNADLTYGRVGKAWFYDSDLPGQEVISTTDVNDGTWHQIVATYMKGGTKSIYVDGAPVEASNSSVPMVTNS